MHIKHQLKQTLQTITRLPLLKVVIPSIGVVAVIIYIFAFVVERPVTFSYVGETCTRQMTWFPSWQQSSGDAKLKVEYEDLTKVGAFPFFSTKACFTLTDAPQAGVAKVAMSPGGSFIARKTFAVTIESLPQAHSDIFDRPIPTAKPLTVPLSRSDAVHVYQLSANQKSVDCQSQDEAAVQCDVSTLQLSQDSAYQVKLARVWGDDQPQTVVTKEVKTLPATHMTHAAITQDQTIFDKPKGFIFEFDKPISRLTPNLAKLDGETKTAIPIEATYDKQKVTLSIKDELPRNSQYQLSFEDFEADDGSTLEVPYIAQFTVSGGPKLTGSNIGATGAGLTQRVVLSFDQPLSDAQDITKFVAVTGVTAQVSRVGNQIIVNYAGAGKCVDFKITVAKGIESNHAIAQAEPQTFSSRTVCHTVQTIGYSKNGRAINAYFFGNGGKTILFTGAIHGSEKSSKYITDSWINDLEAQARNIPAGKQIVVVPLVNPDGFYQYGRYNGNNVNLNRNWPTPNWVSDDATQAGVGGSSPLSEPETQALARFTQNLSPAFVATYHSQGRLVNSNDVGHSITLGQRYASMVRYRFIPDAQTEAVLGGTVTGTYEDWLKGRGTPAILMELDGHTANYFTAHKRALWMLVSDY